MQGYCDVFIRIILKRTSTKAHVYMRRHQGAKIKHCLPYSNVIYHTFSHGAVSYMPNGENVNVMLEYIIEGLCIKGIRSFVLVPWMQLQCPVVCAVFLCVCGISAVFSMTAQIDRTIAVSLITPGHP